MPVQYLRGESPWQSAFELGWRMGHCIADRENRVAALFGDEPRLNVGSTTMEERHGLV